MSSLHAINRATNGNKGGGLPFYENVDYVFSARNPCFNSNNGLWKTERDKCPTFQLWIPESTFVSIRYRQTYGANNFVPMTLPNWFYANASLDSAISFENVTVDGNTETIVSSLYSVTLAPVAAQTKWIIELVVNNGVSNVTYYSEEFITHEC